MAEVTGQIGDNDVRLDNAATETTLRALLLATAKSAKEMDKLLNLAAKAGMNPKDIEAANTAIKQHATTAANSSQTSANATKSLGGLNKGLLIMGGVVGSLASGIGKTASNVTSFAGQLLNGQSSVASFANAFKDLPLGLGLLASIIGKVVGMQEQELDTYRKLTTAGINFAGDLTGIRQNALELGLSLDQFGSLMQNNSETLARFGATANDGAKNFVKLSSDLRKSALGDQLLAMGVGFEQMNQGVMNYLKISVNAEGTRIKDTKAMAEAAGEYIKQQDMLSRLTGRSAEQQQQLLEKESANAAWKNYLLTLDDESREKANASFNDALQKGGVGAADALRSKLMGIPPMTDAGRQFEAMAHNTVSAFDQLAVDIRNPAKSLSDLKTGFDGVTAALGKDGKQFSGELGAVLIAQGGAIGEVVSELLKNTNRNIEQNITGIESATARRLENEQKQANLAESNAAKLAQAQSDLKKIGEQLLDGLAPLLVQLTPIVSDLVKEFTALVIDNMPAIKAGIEIFAEKLKEFGENMFTEAGRNKIMNDIVFFFEDLLITVRQKLDPFFNKKDESAARTELEAKRNLSDAEAAAARAKLAATSQRETGPKPGETEEQARQRLQAEQAAKQQAVESTQQALTAAQLEVDLQNPESAAYKAKFDADMKQINSQLKAAEQQLADTGYSWVNIFQTVTPEMKAAKDALSKLEKEKAELNQKGGTYAQESAAISRQEIDPTSVEHFSKGGIASGPESGYLAMLHGTEAVIPLGNARPTKESLPDIMLRALSDMGQSASKVLDVPEPIKELLKRSTEGDQTAEPETEVTKSVIESSKQLENVTAQLIMLNNQTAEMLEQIKISAEFDRRNLDALNDMNGNAFIRA